MMMVVSLLDEEDEGVAQEGSATTKDTKSCA